MRRILLYIFCLLVTMNIASADDVVLTTLRDLQVTSSPNPSVIGEPVTFTATANIEISYKDGPSMIEPANIGTIVYMMHSFADRPFAVAHFNNGIATVTVPNLDIIAEPYYPGNIIGTHDIYAEYWAGGYYNGIPYNIPDVDRIFPHTINQKPINIPEFPSIAVPVVAVLGLIAIVERRKE